MKALVLLFFTIPVISLGQGICFDFENQDLTGWIPSAEGHWCISEENALEGRFSLKHCYNSDQAGNDRISWIHDPLRLQEAVWSFRVAHQYAPSANNNWSVIISENAYQNSSRR